MIRNLTRTKIDFGHARKYRSARRRLGSIDRSEGVYACIVLHLYYCDSWSLFRDKLLSLKHIRYDIFISMPKQNMHFEEEILKDFPSARIFTVPNRGRDVLAFMQIKDMLSEKGYQYVLKLHSKKSTHRKDGNDWLTDMVDSLIPEDKVLQASLEDTLKKDNTSIIGPKGQYLSLAVNFDANSRHIMRVLNKIYGSDKGIFVERRRNEYGFFAGTMFWVRLDSISKITAKLAPISKYELESGQIDGTFPHALERLFCLVPEINNKNVYEISNKVQKLEYGSGVIPDWSDVEL